MAGGFAELGRSSWPWMASSAVILLLNVLNRQQQISMPLVSIVKN